MDGALPFGLYLHSQPIYKANSFCFNIAVPIRYTLTLTKIMAATKNAVFPPVRIHLGEACSSRSRLGGSNVNNELQENKPHIYQNALRTRQGGVGICRCLFMRGLICSKPCRQSVPELIHGILEDADGTRGPRMITPSWRYGCHPETVLGSRYGGEDKSADNGTIGSSPSSSAVRWGLISGCDNPCGRVGGGADGVNNTRVALPQRQPL